MIEHFSGLIETDDARWPALLPALRHDFYALPAYVAFCAQRESARGVAFVHHTAQGTLLVPLILSRVAVGTGSCLHAGCPYGYPGIALERGASSEPLLAQALAELARCLQVAGVVTAFVRLHPLLELPLGPLERSGILVSHGETVSIDLTSSLEESWRAMRSTHRRHIGAAQKAGYQASMGWEAVDDYVDCYLQTMRRVSASGSYLFERDYVDGLRQAVGENLHLCSVSSAGQVACAGIFSEWDGIVQYHLGGTREAFLRDSPMKLLFDFVRRWAHARGARVLHLGGGVGAQQDALFEFKAGFSERRHRFRTFRLIADPASYAALCSEAGVSTSAAGYFPPFAAPVATRG